MSGQPTADSVGKCKSGLFLQKLKYSCYLVIFAAILCQCSDGPKTPKTSEERQDKLLDSLLGRLVVENPNYDYIPSLLSNQPLSAAFELEKRHFYPYLDSLSFEIRSYCGCGGCWNHRLIYIHNSTAQYILPLIDDYHFWRASGDWGYSVDSLRNILCFESEMNKASKHFKFDQNIYERERFIQIIMELRGYRAMNGIDICMLNAQGKEMEQDTRTYNDHCRTNYRNNLAIIEKELNFPSSGKRVFSNLQVTYIVDFSGSTLGFNVLNMSCDPQILF